MKKINIVLMVVLILMIAFVVYFFVGGTLKPLVTFATAPAADHPDAFASIQGVLAAHAAPQQFAELDGDAGRYTLVDMNVQLSNHGIFDAEWVDVDVAPAHGDVAVYSFTGEGSDIPARSVGSVNLKLITTNPSAGRDITITYYVHGMQRTVSVTAGF